MKRRVSIFERSKMILLKSAWLVSKNVYQIRRRRLEAMRYHVVKSQLAVVGCGASSNVPLVIKLLSTNQKESAWSVPYSWHNNVSNICWFVPVVYTVLSSVISDVFLVLTTVGCRVTVGEPFPVVSIPAFTTWFDILGVFYAISILPGQDLLPVFCIILSLWLVNQLWFIVPVSWWKYRASSELLYKSIRPQVSMVYKLINHLGCSKNTRRIHKSLACSSWFTNSFLVLPISRVVYQPVNHRNLWSMA